MTSSPVQLAERVEAAVLAVRGVERVYRQGSLVSALRDAGSALGIRSDPSVGITETDAGITVEASIGVDGSLRAADVLAAVRAAIAGALDSETVHRIAVTIAHVHPHEAAHA